MSATWSKPCSVRLPGELRPYDLDILGERATCGDLRLRVFGGGAWRRAGPDDWRNQYDGPFVTGQVILALNVISAAEFPSQGTSTPWDAARKARAWCEGEARSIAERFIDSGDPVLSTGVFGAWDSERRAWCPITTVAFLHFDPLDLRIDANGVVEIRVAGEDDGPRGLKPRGLVRRAMVSGPLDGPLDEAMMWRAAWWVHDQLVSIGSSALAVLEEGAAGPGDAEAHGR